jgi:hypothetical protein
MSIATPAGITKILASGAVALGAWVVAAAPAGADPNSYGADPSPFSSLTCSSQVTAPPAGLAASEDLNRGIRDGLAT